MFEIERKFQIDEQSKARIISAAKFLGRKTFTDIYYDTNNCTLTGKDNWLRQRDGVWELKVTMNKEYESHVDQYEEITDEEKIKEYLKLDANKSLIEGLATAGFTPFCTLTTMRESYELGEFTIVFDDATAQDFHHQVGEIEIVVEDESLKEETIAKINAFAKEYGVSFEKVRGKVSAYLKEKLPVYYQALKNFRKNL